MSAPVSLEIFCGFFLSALVFMPLERFLPSRDKKTFRPEWASDIVYYVVGCFVGHLSDSASLAAMLLIRHATGLTPGNFISHQPVLLQFVEIVLTTDFLAYWFHRSLHRRALLWRLHRVHHGSKDMDWLANVHLHPVDKLLGDCFQFVPVFFLGFSSGPLLAYTIALGFQGFLNHSNVRLDYGPLRWIIASPQFHHWHHSNDPQFFDRNFSPHLVIWDRLFGTFYLPADRSLPRNYGVPETIPPGFWSQMIYPLRPLHTSAPAVRARSLSPAE